MEELRKLRKLNDEASSLAPSLRPCPFLAQQPEELVAEDLASRRRASDGSPPTDDDESIFAVSDLKT